MMDSVATRELTVKNLVTPDYALDESITLIRLAHSHSKAADFARTTINSRVVKILYMEEEILEFLS